MFPERVCHHCLILTAGAFAHAVFRFLQFWVTCRRGGSPSSHFVSFILPVLPYPTKQPACLGWAPVVALDINRPDRHAPTPLSRKPTRAFTDLVRKHFVLFKLRAAAGPISPRCGQTCEWARCTSPFLHSQLAQSRQGTISASTRAFVAFWVVVRGISVIWTVQVDRGTRVAIDPDPNRTSTHMLWANKCGASSHLHSVNRCDECDGP